MADKRPTKKDEEEDEDPRLEYFMNYLIKSMKIKQEKWTKMMATEEYKNIVMNFIAKPQETFLLYIIAQSGQLTPVTSFPASMKSKSCYFIKRANEAVTKENYRTLFIFGDMSPKPVDELATLVEEVFAPILSNPENHIGWPSVVAEDITQHIHTFRNTVTQIKGALQHQTLLAMPSGIHRIYDVELACRDSNGENVDLYLKAAIEGIIIKWATQINEILKENSAVVFAEGDHPTPRVEIEFWKDRLKNLESIYDQMRDPRVKKMASYLELTNSTYLPCLKNLFRNVVSAVTEARDITLYLKPMEKYFDLFEGQDLLQNEEHILPMFHCLCLVWVNSRFYCNSSKIIVLLQEMSNMMIEATEKQLDPGTLFQSDLDEALIKLDKCMTILDHFMNCFEEHRQKLETYFPAGIDPLPWAFHPRMIFQRILLFIERLKLVYDVFETAVEYLKLEKVVVGGIKGRDLTVKVEHVHEEFNKIYNIFLNITYEPLQPEFDHFVLDYNIFKKQVLDLDQRLAAIAVQAFEECETLMSMVKMMSIWGNLLERPIIKEQMLPHYPKLIAMQDVQLDIVKELFDKGVDDDDYLVDIHFPPIAAKLFWLHKLRCRLKAPMDELADLENLIMLSEEGEQMQLKYDEMLDFLEAEEIDVFTDWAESVPEKCQMNLNKSLLIRSQEEVLCLNFDPELVAILREVRYMNILERDDIPDEALELFDRVEELHRNTLTLNRTIQWYNWLRTRTKPVELDLITDQIISIDKAIDTAIETLDWNLDVWEIINEMHTNVKDLYDRVYQAQVNLRKVLTSMDKWAAVPLYDRKDGKKEQLLYLDDQVERCTKRYNNIKQSAEDIAQMLDENYKLFFRVEMPKLDLDEEEEVVVEEMASPTPIPSRKGGKRKKKGDQSPTDESPKGKGKSKKKGDQSPGDESPKGKGKGKKKGSQSPADESPKGKGKGKSKEGKGKKGGKGKNKNKGKQKTDESEPDEDHPEFPDEEAPPGEYEMSEEERRMKWEEYLSYVDSLIGEMFLKAVMYSFGVFLSEMESGVGKKAPLFEVALELQDPVIQFIPSLDQDEEDCFLNIMNSLIEDIIAMCEMIPRVTVNTDAYDYRSLIENNLDIVDLIKETLSRVKEGTEKAVKYSEEFEKYSYLWLDNRQSFLKQFLAYGRLLTPEEIEFMEDETFIMKETPPTIPQFKEQIDLYEELYNTVKAFPSVEIIDDWLRIDVRPLRQAILNTICKWGNLFKQHLVEHVISSLDELENFCKEANGVLQKELNDDDYEGLLHVMEYLFMIKERQLTTDAMFEPLREIIELLKQYNVEFEEDVHVQLAELPDKWTYTKKLSITTKQVVAPLQANQVNLLRKRINLFELRQNMYKDAFKKYPFFKFDCEDVYTLLDNSNEEIIQYENEMKKLEESSGLFEVSLPEFKAIKQCRKEVRQIKQLWDYVYIVQSCIDEWKMTPWKKIDVENMEMECKKFAKEIRGFDKELRGWDPYIQIEATVKNMLTSLRAVTELQNPAIRERHWTQLMQTTKVKFVMDDKTTLNDLLALNLHHYEEEVKTIVDKSVKEMSMEKTLKELNAVWSAMEFEVTIHERSKIKLLRATEELIETLEDNQVQLQNLMTSKFIDYFLEEVSEWQHILSVADQVIGSFFEVQRKWMYLESIFIGSEDIRSQLPEDSRRFERIDREFKEIVNQMNVNLNVVKSTSKPNLFEKLEAQLADLILCEKALNDYLETKRLAFPRFYFVSSADLLDILSIGNQPELVQKHLTKLYDSIGKLRFAQEAGKNTKNAKAMIAKEHDELVMFSGVCDCSGKVEIWLNRLTEAMRKTLVRLFLDAVVAYDEKPREQWLYDWPAQVALCGTQIWWTTEVNIAFSRLEEGYENALKDYQKKQIQQLSSLILLLLGDLTPGDRQKIMTICTIDVHSRDVVAKMIAAKVEASSAFQWQSQLRHRWDEKLNNCYANICDAQFLYQYEYLGNTPRLVITPLTDRCYITLTQSLHLIMGGAPAGPAGTGKTETTKDLGRALGVMVYVFNCSEQMDYRSCGNIYKGLSQTGAWGCFDEFNRISVEVLSVVSVQVKTIQDAIKTKKTMFNFMGESIVLKHTVGLFITMNPGYAGRTELPENLKALFRPCAMVVPDFELICEIMLIAEGFQDARLLARKFITLYTLCRELLSKQDHYDWGLRAIKSVLVVAGSLKRSDRQRPEDQVLMRALRDFNIPKIITDDIPIFMGLIGDLFPALDVPRKRDMDFEKIVKKSITDLKLQPEDNFVLKIIQLEELFAVRHCVFVLGNPGTGKTMVWKSLFKTYQNQKRKPFYNDLDPKAVTNDELFGVINPATREWKDGLFSVLMRDQANLTGDGPKWIVLDGDIDPMWIESLNTVMDDNKVLTLASNERIALTKAMRLLFEIATLRTATPATVSRAGILYINPADLGWNPYITSWIDTREQQSERANLIILFDKYVPPCLEVLRLKFKTITPIPETSHLNMLCYLLDSFLTPLNVPTDCPKEWYEIYFVFACVWAFGSALFQDQLVDWRNEFSKWWTNEFKTVKFPVTGTVFSYYIDPETKKFLPWADLVKSFELDLDLPLQAVLVHTMETTRLRFFLDILIAHKHPVMLVGSAGSGKTVVVEDKLEYLPDSYVITNVPLNFYTTSEMLQKILEKPLEKKAGRNFGPPGNKNMIYFIDDLNMPEVDTYGTVQPHTLIRQHMDYGHWYDRIKLTLKEIHNVQYVSCMNPTAGSFTIDGRLQRHFCVFACSFPSQSALHRIYNSIFSQHLGNPFYKIPLSTQRLCETLVEAALVLHLRLTQTFLPTAIKFHYIFNLRDLSNIFTGLLFARADCLSYSMDLIRLWMHEATRVYCDKLVEKKDIDLFEKILCEVVKKGFEELDEPYVMAKPLVFCHFAEGIGDPKYLPIKEWKHLEKILEEALSGYNDLIGAMNLVLFEDAMYHICRINRILEAPRGNALLIGVGGSGKQSLSRLAAFISSLDVFQIQLRKGYSINDMKANLSTLYFKAGVKNTGSVFLMSDAQVADEIFLVLINDMLASGEIPELFPDDETENIIAALRPEVKGVGLIDSRENCWKYFIERCRRLLKIVLCFSPVGSTLRIRARKFPALVNCSSINWFHEWPLEALLSVSKQFLSELEVLPPYLVNSVSDFMSFVHTSVNEMSQVYLQNDKRYNYTTPKSFLEQIALYSKLLAEKMTNLVDRTVRLSNGLQKLASTTDEVDVLKVQLASQEVVLKQKNDAADALIQVLSVENEAVAREQAIAADEEARVTIIEEDVSAQAAVCAEDLRRAEPALLAAQEALNTLNKNNLTELKSFGTPPDAVVNVTAAVLVLFSEKGRIPKDRSWKACKLLMGKVDQFLNDLIYYDKENIHPDVQKAILPYINNPEFSPEKIMSKSAAAAGLCSWVINIMKFYDVYVVVEPKRRAFNKAQAELTEARNKLIELKDKLGELQRKLNILKAEFEEATEAKLKCQAEADATAYTINIANRLINGLASENIRWRELIKTFNLAKGTLPGDVLLSTAFLSYVGCFTKSYRNDLENKHWIPYLNSLEPPIPMAPGLDCLSLLTDDAQVAQWNNEGLPTDRMSTENATIMVNSTRWPLMIDPQLQGLKWVKNKYGESLNVIRLGMKNYLDTIERCIANGEVVLLEYIGETIDAVLDPLLSRALIKKGKIIKIGDKEIDFDPNFRLILQSKLANPHYKPEMQAQATLINFTVTRDGLEEQLLAEVVKSERPDLEELKTELTTSQNNFKIILKTLEDDLLMRLSSAGANILSDISLVENLETTKRTSTEIEIKVHEARTTGVKIDEAREQYRSCATRASLLYFILNELHRINAIYLFSLKAFSVVFKDALTRAIPAEKLTTRVANLLDCITFSVYMYTSRGLFEKDKLIFLCLMTIQILVTAKEVNPEELDYLLRYPIVPTLNSPVEFLSIHSWGGIKALSKMDEFRNLDKDIQGSSKRWFKFVEAECPEKEKFPQEWKNKNALQRLCMMRALRPDRMTYALTVFVEEKLGTKFVEARAVEFAKSFEETSSSVPTFFILSPGVDPLKDVEKLGNKIGFKTDNRNFHNVSLGQGQEEVAENAMELASNAGHWVILQNIHLVQRWLPTLEKKLEQYSLGSHDSYRLFISAEPNPDPQINIIPQGILESSIKITNEPPTGMLANLHKALDNFTQETLEMCSKEAEFKAILFSLCYFHAVVAERRKFGAQGWNRVYPFNIGDLTISVYVLYNYMENNNKIPWEDLRYLFGEIMYGGHITDDWDRRLCRTFLAEYMQPELIDGDLYFAQGFPAPPNTDYVGYHRFIDDFLPSETPLLYGLHPNAEIGVLTATAENLFRTIFEMQPKDTGGSGGVTVSREDKVKIILEDIQDKLPEEYNIPEIMAKVEERTPYIIVAFQECERMNILTREMRRSLKELELGLKGELTITSDMEKLEGSLFLDYVPDNWTRRAYPSLLPLGQWFADFQLRMKELENWAADFLLPAAVWLAGFFNPQSFLTAIMQQTARKNEWPLDKMCLLCDVTKKTREEFNAPPREGAYVYGFYMEGARWDTGLGSITNSKLKELFPLMPVIYIKAITQDKQDLRNMYECPVYKTRMRGPTFVWTFNLRTKEKAAKWTLAGVALLLQI